MRITSKNSPTGISIFIETDRGKSILENLAFLLSIIIIQSNVELLRWPIIRPIRDESINNPLDFAHARSSVYTWNRTQRFVRAYYARITPR